MGIQVAGKLKRKYRSEKFILVDTTQEAEQLNDFQHTSLTTTTFEVIMELLKNQVTPLHIRCSIVQICRTMADMYMDYHQIVLFCSTDQKREFFYCITC